VTDFKIGDKVKCINKRQHQFIEVGKIYTVKEVARGTVYDSLYLEEIFIKHSWCCYDSRYFIKVYPLKDKLTLVKELIR
jgi:hypothetical protein